MYKEINSSHKRVIIYIIVGGAAFVADNTAFFVLFKLVGISLLVSTITALLVGFIVSFLGNKLLVFGSEDEEDVHKTYKQLLFYIFLLIFNMIFSYMFIKIMDGIFGYPVVFKVIAAIIIVFWNFVIYKKIIFKKA